jgi:hypothetical protein
MSLSRESLDFAMVSMRTGSTMPCYTDMSAFSRISKIIYGNHKHRVFSNLDVATRDKIDCSFAQDF